ncbi:MAG: hypothetical protein E3J94_00425 [Desulfobacteraceae bacterium]|nr:MAG: hypothetical protein E3J94_00425 [Desulfobacteraceae bacterium]
MSKAKPFSISKRVVQGWINYYGQYYRSALYPIFKQLDNALRKWVMRKYKRLRGRKRKFD